jgi:hypothetical protein
MFVMFVRMFELVYMFLVCPDTGQAYTQRWTGTGRDGDEMLSSLDSLLDTERCTLLLRLANVATAHVCADASTAAVRLGAASAWRALTCSRQDLVGQVPARLHETHAVP